jgi:hypothetical protein
MAMLTVMKLIGIVICVFGVVRHWQLGMFKQYTLSLPTWVAFLTLLILDAKQKSCGTTQ